MKNLFKKTIAQKSSKFETVQEWLAGIGEYSKLSTQEILEIMTSGVLPGSDRQKFEIKKAAILKCEQGEFRGLVNVLLAQDRGLNDEQILEIFSVFSKECYDREKASVARGVAIYSPSVDDFINGVRNQEIKQRLARKYEALEQQAERGGASIAPAPHGDFARRGGAQGPSDDLEIDDEMLGLRTDSYRSAVLSRVGSNFSEANITLNKSVLGARGVDSAESAASDAGKAPGANAKKPSTRRFNSSQYSGNSTTI